VAFQAALIWQVWLYNPYLVQLAELEQQTSARIQGTCFSFT